MEYTDQEINQVAEWWASLSLRELFFIKELYEAFLESQLTNSGDINVH